MVNKAIIIDIDGTIVDSPAQTMPTKRLIDAVKALKSNYKVLVATGRPWPMARNIINTLEIQEPCIISAGTQICNPKTGEILVERKIDTNDVKELADILAKDYKIKAVWNSVSVEDYENGYKTLRALDIKDDYFVIALVYLNHDKALDIIKRIRPIKSIIASQVVSYRKGLIDLHITSSNATKEHAIADVLKLINVKKQNVIGVGDGGNDSHLFAAVGYKIAMGNAVKSLKDKADLIIGKVDDDGLAKYLETLAS